MVTGPGHQFNVCMSLVSTLLYLTESSVCVETFLRHPRCAWRSKGSLVICFGRRTDRRTKLLTFKGFSMSTGASTSMNSLYRVSRDDRPVRSCLTEKGRASYHWKGSCISGITILRERYCSSLCYNQSQPANNARVGGISTLVAQETGKIDEGIHATDE